MSKNPVLNQVVALVTGKKSQYQKAITKSYHGLKQEQVDGLIRNYVPFDDEDKNKPNDDSKGIALDLKELIKDFGVLFADIVDIVATNDVGNQQAKADVVVDELVVLKDVPVTHLLYLEKALLDAHTFISGLPVLNPMRQWTWDDGAGVYKTAPVATTRTAKRKTKFVKAEATDKHPAQVEVFDEDVPVGTWETTYISSAIPLSKKKEYLQRIDALRDAIKRAREVANSIEVENVKFGDNIIEYIFAEERP